MRVLNALATETRLTIMVAGWLLAVAGVRRRSRLGTAAALAGLKVSRMAVKAGLPSMRKTSKDTIRLMKVA